MINCIGIGLRSESTGTRWRIAYTALIVDCIEVCSVSLQVMLVSSYSCKQLGFWKPPLSFPRRKSCSGDTLHPRLGAIPTGLVPVAFDLSLLA